MPLRSPWVRSTKQLPAGEQKSVVLGTSDALGKFLILGANGATTPGAALSLYEQSTAVSIPINMVTDPFAVLQPILLIDGKRAHGHPAVEFLKAASPYYEQELFLETLAKDYLITGETDVVAIGRVHKEPLELQPISPRVVSVPENGATGVPESFHVTGVTMNGVYRPERRKNQIRYYDGGLRELRQIRNWSTKNNSLLRGQSRLVSAAKEVRQHILGSKHNVSLLEKGGRISVIFHFNAEMDDDTFKANAARIREQYGGAAQAGEIGVTTGEQLEIKQTGISNIDMDFTNLQELAITSVALQYRVPLPLINKGRQTLNNYGQGRLALFDDAVIPLAAILFGGLGTFLLPRFGLDPTRARYTFDPDEVSALVTRRTEELLKRRQIGVETDNELRGMMTREPVEGGNVIYKPAAMIPIGTDLDTSDELPEDLDAEEFESA